MAKLLEFSFFQKMWAREMWISDDKLRFLGRE